jgi:hypothetical protein
MTARAAPAPRIAMPDMPAPLVVPPAPSPPPVAPPLEMPQRSLAAPEPARAEPRPEDFADLASFMAAKRRARGQSASGPSTPEDDDIARRDAIVAANLAGINAPDFGAERRNSGGLFQITRLGYDEAEFTFFGWNRDIRRRASQRIEVQRGDAADIRIAIVRRMIAIIREYEQGDFTWRSNRLGRDVTLSARLDDNAGLEEFMLREFFANPRGPG